MSSKNVLFVPIFYPNLSFLSSLSFFLSFLSLKHVSYLDKTPKGQENKDSVTPSIASLIKFKVIICQAPRTHNTGVKGVKEDARAHQLYILHKEQEKQDQLAKAAARFSLNGKYANYCKGSIF